MPAGFHPHSHGYISLLQFLVKLFGFFAMTQPPFTQFTRVGVHESNLLEARMIVTTYNQHVRLSRNYAAGASMIWNPKSGGFALEVVNLQVPVLAFVKLRSPVDERHPVAQHAIHQSSQLGCHSFYGNREPRA